MLNQDATQLIFSIINVIGPFDGNARTHIRLQGGSYS
ncbi:hypothetical protein EVA_03132 [gut metagenome]|uniref:Uncharacterized protein n=1 Tax=gut metagenome TaxID=749906 RepID=J9H4K9_9ZZZZ